MFAWLKTLLPAPASEPVLSLDGVSTGLDQVTSAVGSPPADATSDEPDEPEEEEEEEESLSESESDTSNVPFKSKPYTLTIEEDILVGVQGRECTAFPRAGCRLQWTLRPATGPPSLPSPHFV